MAGAVPKIKPRPKPFLQGWAIYDHPRDCRDFFIARRWLATERGALVGTHDTFRHTDVEIVRRYVRDQLSMSGQTPVCLPRWANDDPVIMEVWI